MSGQCVLIVDDDPAITEALSITLERGGRKTIVCADVEAAEVALERFPVTHLVSDVQFSGEFGFEGLHFLERVRRLAPACRVVLMTGNHNPALLTEGLRQGAAVVLSSRSPLPISNRPSERARKARTTSLTTQSRFRPSSRSSEATWSRWRSQRSSTSRPHVTRTVSSLNPVRGRWLAAARPCCRLPKKRGACPTETAYPGRAIRGGRLLKGPDFKN